MISTEDTIISNLHVFNLKNNYALKTKFYVYFSKR